MCQEKCQYMTLVKQEEQEREEKDTGEKTDLALPLEVTRNESMVPNPCVKQCGDQYHCAKF